MKTILGLLLVSLLTAGYVLGTGVYNMAATEKHWLITEKLIEWMRNNSIAARANELEIPAMDEEKYLVTGAQHYDAMCTGCHLSPGQEPTELAQGLYPQAPVFYQSQPLVDSESVQEQLKAYFWVIKNGIKMTAMPAWGLTHDDETVWAMAFFVQQLGGMSESRYHELARVNENKGDHDHSNVHQNGHEHHHEHDGSS